MRVARSERHVPYWTNKHPINERLAKSEAASGCLLVGLVPLYGRMWGHVKMEERVSGASERSFMYIRNKSRPKTLPWSSPATTGRGEESLSIDSAMLTMRVSVRKSGMKGTLYTTGMIVLGEQVRMPDYINCLRYVQ